MNRKKRRETGAIAIEAVLSLTIFLMAMLALMMGSMLIRAQAAMQYALNQTAKEISGYFYLLDKFGIASAISGNSTDAAQASFQQLNDSIGHIVSFSGDVKDEIEEKKSDYGTVVSDVKAGTLSDDDIERIKNIPADAKETSEAIQKEIGIIKGDLKNLKSADKKEMFKGVLQVFSKALINTALSKYVTPLVCEALVPKYLTSKDLDNFYQQSGIIEDSINFQGSQMLADGRTITLVVTYQIDASKLTLGFYRKNLQFQQMASTAAWVHENDSGSLLSLKDVDYCFDIARNEKRSEELNALRAANEAVKKARQERADAFKEELDKHEADGEDSSSVEKAMDDKDDKSKDGKDDKDDKSKDGKDDKDDKSKDGKDDKSKGEEGVKNPYTEPIPRGKGIGSSAFWEAYDRLSEDEKKSFIFNYNYIRIHVDPTIDLAEVVSNCKDKDGALQMIHKESYRGAMLLITTGDEGTQAYNKLDKHGQTLLCGGINLSSDEVNELVEFINGGTSDTISTDDIDNFVNRRIKPAEEDKLCNPVTTAPSRAQPAAATTTQPIYTKNKAKGNRAELTANNTYSVGSDPNHAQYDYSTDNSGRIVSVSGKLERHDGERNSYAQSQAGREDRIRAKDIPQQDKGKISPDDGGHLIATIFNGDGGLDNMVAMNRNLNRGAWEQMERDWADLLSKNYDVEVSIQVEYDPNSNSQRPTRFFIKTTVTDPVTHRTDTFDEDFYNKDGQSYTKIEF